MPPSLCLHLHPSELAAGMTVIAAASGAVRLPGAGLLVAWDYAHTLVPLFPDEEAAGTMLEMAAAALGCEHASRCFRFIAAPRPRGPGVVPPRAPVSNTSPRLRFAPTLTALAASVRSSGTCGVIVSNGQRTPDEPTAVASFYPGILRIYPRSNDSGSDDVDGAFLGLDFPTLVLDENLAPGASSAHEVLDFCRRLADCMAKDVHAFRHRATPSC